LVLDKGSGSVPVIVCFNIIFFALFILCTSGFAYSQTHSVLKNQTILSASPNYKDTSSTSDVIQIILRNETSRQLITLYGIAITGVAAIGGSIIGSVLTQRHNIKIAERKIDERRRREEERSRRQEENLRKRLISENLTQLKYSIESLLFRLYNLMYKGRPGMSDEYYTTSTLHLLGTIFAYHGIFLSYGIYPQIDEVFPGLGNYLQGKLEEFGRNIDHAIQGVSFDRYDRILLGEAVTLTENGKPRPSSYLKFSEMYTNEKGIQRILEPAANFVVKLKTITNENSRAKTISIGLSDILEKIEERTSIKVNADLKKKMDEFKLADNFTHQREKKSPI
jgi:hypothetical protein